MSHQWFVLSATRGLDERQQPTTDGANGYALEAENMGFGQAGAFVMRLGMAAQVLTSSGITGIVEWLGKFVTNAGVEELWAASNNAGTANLARRASGTFSTVTFSDTVTVSDLRYLHSAMLNGKHFIAYNSNVNRLHVWDGTTLRRVGIAKPAAAPTVANGAGAGAASARRYRVVFYVMSGTDIVAQSELSSAANSFTPAGANSAVVTRPTTPDSATHWAVYAIAGSTDTYALYKKISGAIAVGTTTFDDTTDPAVYTGDAPAALGAFIPPPSCKYLVSDGAHLIMAGAWEASGGSDETAPKQNRVWWTPALGSSDLGDDERVPATTTQRNWIDIGDGGPILGLAGPLYGDTYVFKADSIGKLVATGGLEAPFRYVPVTDAVGAIGQRLILKAEDGEGVPTVYFASRTGVYSLSQGGIGEISEPVRRDLRLSNFSAPLSFLGWDPIEKTLVAQTNSASPGATGQYNQFAYDVASDRWTGLTLGEIGAGWVLGRSLLGLDTILSNAGEVRCAVTALDEDGIPRLHLGGVSTNSAGAIYAYGAQGGVDGSTTVPARMRVRVPLGLMKGSRVWIGHPTLIYRNPIGSTATTATLTVSYIREDGLTESDSQTLDATDSDDPIGQKRVTLEKLQLSDVFVFDLRIVWSYTAAFAATVPPAIDAILIPFDLKEELAA